MRNRDTGLLEDVGGAKTVILAPGSGDQLNADRHRVGKERDRGNRKTDAGNRLREEAEVGSDGDGVSRATASSFLR